MLSAAVYLLTHSLLLSLHLAGNTGSFPKPLTAEEERMYLERSAQGDIEARNVLVEHNLRLVAHIVKKYYTQESEQDDLISIGTIGLIKGISSYKPEKNTRLATYAAKCIENEILMYFRSRKKSQNEVSLSDSIDTDKDGNNLYLIDIVGVDDTMYADLQDREDCVRVRALVHECLTPREEEIVSLRYGLGGRMPRTQREIAAKLGISRSYVSRIEKRALEKLEDALGGKR
ncbi:MAG: sigma-70 family RNA polymerase sigma factor [Ruminococcaceae bacterium]|nr:sigma-70 family RNA polymerase sigma factor [Oscillospiraceae bacterium]